MHSIPKYLFAFLGAALIPALVFIIPYSLRSLALGDGHGWERIQHYSFVMVYIAVFHAMVLGGPLFIVMHRKKLIYWWSTLLAGFVIGCVPMTIWSWSLHVGERLPSLTEIAATGVIGAGGGFIFWFIWQQFQTRQSHQQSISTQ